MNNKIENLFYKLNNLLKKQEAYHREVRDKVIEMEDIALGDKIDKQAIDCIRQIRKCTNELVQIRFVSKVLTYNQNP